MPDYRLYTCPVCLRLFQPEDDIVVCPLCGAPHHRECWKVAGGCAHRAFHGTPNQWKAPVFREDDEALVCGNCGVINRHGDAVCSHCGHELNEPLPDPLEHCPEMEAADFFTSAGPYTDVPPDGVVAQLPAVQLASFIGPRLGYYLARFRFIEQTHKISWNWCALFFPLEWLLYRKMYGRFFCFLALWALLAVPEALLLWNTVAGWTGQSFSSLPSWVAYLSQGCFSATLFLRLVVGNMGTKWYFRHCLRTIAQLRIRYPAPDVYRRRLSRRGGVNPVGVAIFYVVLVLGAAALVAGWLRLF